MTPKLVPTRMKPRVGTVSFYNHSHNTQVSVAQQSECKTVDMNSNHGSFYSESPIVYHPILPVPGDFEPLGPSASSHRWPAHPLPAYMGSTFSALCKYWTLFQARNIVHYDASDETLPLQNTMPLAQAEEWYQKLLSWSDTLQDSLARGPSPTTHVLSFQ